MIPVENDLDSYKELCRHFDTFILLTSPWENKTALADKLNCVRKYLGQHAHKRLILSHHKNLNMGNLLIDDRTKN